jgi:hypothetical protein
VLEAVRGLKSLGVEVRFEKKNISSFDGDGELMLTVLSSFVHWNSKPKWYEGSMAVSFLNVYGKLLNRKEIFMKKYIALYNHCVIQ